MVGIFVYIKELTSYTEVVSGAYRNEYQNLSKKSKKKYNMQVLTTLQ